MWNFLIGAIGQGIGAAVSGIGAAACTDDACRKATRDWGQAISGGSSLIMGDVSGISGIASGIQAASGQPTQVQKTINPSGPGLTNPLTAPGFLGSPNSGLVESVRQATGVDIAAQRAQFVNPSADVIPWLGNQGPKPVNSGNGSADRSSFLQSSPIGYNRFLPF